jgi:hypothetical protein
MDVQPNGKGSPHPLPFRRLKAYADSVGDFMRWLATCVHDNQQIHIAFVRRFARRLRAKKDDTLGAKPFHDLPSEALNLFQRDDLRALQICSPPEG